VSQRAAAIERLGDSRQGEVAAIAVGLFLLDSQGTDTFDTLFRAQPDIPILILSRLSDENVARLAVQRGAQDYLLEERLDGDSLPRALASMLERSARSAALFPERERAEVTLASIGDAVISTDVEGNITYLNRVAESMTGWSRQEAAGRPLLRMRGSGQ
jgi:PAS domain-containing protein